MYFLQNLQNMKEAIEIFREHVEAGEKWYELKEVMRDGDFCEYRQRNKALKNGVADYVKNYCPETNLSINKLYDIFADIYFEATDPKYGSIERGLQGILNNFAFEKMEYEMRGGLLPEYEVGNWWFVDRYKVPSPSGRGRTMCRIISAEGEVLDDNWGKGYKTDSGATAAYLDVVYIYKIFQKFPAIQEYLYENEPRYAEGGMDNDEIYNFLRNTLGIQHGFKFKKAFALARPDGYTARSYMEANE